MAATTTGTGASGAAGAEAGESGHDAAKSYEVEKRRLECVVLRHQVELNERPWFRKIGVWAAIIPILVATVTLGTQLYTGYYQTQSRLAALEKKEIGLLKESAANDRKQIEETQKATQAELARLEETRKQVVIEKEGLAAESERLTRAKQDFAVVERSYEAAREQLTVDQQALAELRMNVNEERAALKAEQAAIEAKMEAIASQLRFAPILSHVETLVKATSDRVSPQHTSSKALIELIAARRRTIRRKSPRGSAISRRTN